MRSPVEVARQPEPWMTPGEAATYLRLPSVRALYQRVARGQIKADRLGRSLRFHRRALDAVLGRDGRS